MRSSQLPLQFKILGMDCAEEVAVLKREIGPVVGGEDRLAFDILNGKMTIQPLASEVAPEAIIRAVARTGMRAEVWRDTARDDAGALEVECTKPADDTTLAHIVRLVAEAQSRRTPSEQWVEKFVRVYTPAVMGLAIGHIQRAEAAFRRSPSMARRNTVFETLAIMRVPSQQRADRSPELCVSAELRHAYWGFMRLSAVPPVGATRRSCDRAASRRAP